jgi:hypothetical protein
MKQKHTAAPILIGHGIEDQPERPKGTLDRVSAIEISRQNQQVAVYYPGEAQGMRQAGCS